MECYCDHLNTTTTEADCNKVPQDYCKYKKNQVFTKMKGNIKQWTNISG